MTTAVTRADLQQLQGISPRLLRAFEDLFVDTAATSEAVGEALQSTGAIQNATVITLSSNNAFANERVLVAGSGITLDAEAGTVTIDVKHLVATQGGFKCTLNLQADTSVDLPTSGRIGTRNMGDVYADDAAAAAAGIQVGEIYRKAAGVVTWRQA